MLLFQCLKEKNSDAGGAVQFYGVLEDKALEESVFLIECLGERTASKWSANPIRCKPYVGRAVGFMEALQPMGFVPYVIK